jgi:valyl-tRNA synthetase
MIELEKSYDASQVEDRIYKQWLDSGYFNPDNLEGTPYSIVLPPPNVTGTLHIGHALMVVIQDILIRYKRMNGFKTLWLPGTDHAAIATQSKVEKLLDKEEGKRKHDLGRDEFLTRVDKFAQESHDTIVGQVKAIGSSVDWSREAYTLDETRSKAVRAAFKIMYDAGLIYRGYRVINWDPKGQTTISDDEIVHEERKAQMYTFKYSKEFPISISTTRPETKVGDTAVAVHPEDDRYKQFIGQEFDTVFCGVPIHIKVIADESVEKDFGTGALGVTPAHSMIDYEIAQRHDLPM